VRSVVIVAVLRLAKPVIEQMDIVGNAVFVQQLIELVCIGAL
jgi:hypothetical protein